MSYDDVLEELGKRSLQELMYMICGDKLGQGMSRSVYRYALNPDYVVKVENYVDKFQNVKEYEIWYEHKDYEAVAKWLCPCLQISDGGVFLIQRYARDIVKEDIPDTLPSFITDTKLANFGMLDGRVVVRDYGTTLYNLSARQRKVTKNTIWEV